MTSRSNHRATAIIGATTWGTTLSIMLATKGAPVTLLTRTPAESDLLNAKREHARFLPGASFPEGLAVSSDAESVLSGARLVILAVPSDRLRQNVRAIGGHLSADAIVLSATKGLELPSARHMSQVLEEELPPGLHPGICALSGPNLAKEIVQGKPASTVIAGRNREATETAQSVLMSNSFRVYTSTDLVGVELAGALKNIVALGAGISDGLRAGDNAKSAFMTRGLAEITRLGIAAGAEPLTFAGLAGLGDVIATCSSPLSRNHFVGEQLAQGRSWPEIREAMDNVAEGVNATQAALKLAGELNVEMPIAQVTYRVLFEGLSPLEAAAGLMERPPRSEW